MHGGVSSGIIYRGRGRSGSHVHREEQINTPAGWTFLKRRGHQPYTPHMTSQQLASNRGGYLPCVDRRQGTPGKDRHFAVAISGGTYTGRPVMRVWPRIGIPDSTTDDHTTTAG